MKTIGPVRWGCAVALGMLTAAGSASAAAFSTSTFTGDIDSGISSSKTYTHAVDLFGNNLTINGVNFVAGGAGAQTGYTLNIQSSPALGTFSGYSAGATGTINSLLSDFFYSQNPGTAIETLQLTGLTPGQTYVTTFYNAAFGGVGGRPQIVTADVGGAAPFAYDQNFAALNLLQYSFVADGTAQITYTITSTTGNNSFHQYGFTNELVPTPEASHVLLAAVGGLALVGFARRRFFAAA